MSEHIIEIDDIRVKYVIERKETKTIKFKIYPDLTIKAIVPFSISEEEVHERIENRQQWIKKNIAFFSENRTKDKKRLISGSSIYYLGKQYRIRIQESPKNEIKLVGKYLVVGCKSQDSRIVEGVIDKWYRIHAQTYFMKIAEKCLLKLEKYGISMPTINIRRMKTRWGSCVSNKNKIILNIELIKKSRICIEYVIMHELCHLKYPNHNIQFYTFFSIVMPDREARKKRLEGLRL